MPLDDETYVTGNALVRDGLKWSNVAAILRDGRLANWIPVTEFSHALDCHWFALRPAGHHVTSLFLHGVNTALVFVFFFRVTNCFWRSAFVAAIFGVHPLHVESVVWIAERKDVLSTFFLLLTLLFYVGYVARAGALPRERARGKGAGGGRGGSGCYVASLLFFALGLMSKPMLVTAPFLLLLLDYWPLQRLAGAGAARTSLGRLLLEKTPFLILAIADGLATVWAQRGAGAMEAITAVPFGARMGNALVSTVLYLAKTFWPVKSAVFYPFPPPWPAWQVLGAALLLGAVTLLVFVTRRTHPYQWFGWLWFGLTLAPVIGIVQVGAQGMADRYMYIPQMGIVVLVTWTVADLGARLRARSWAAVAAGGVVLTCAWLTRAQVARWNSSETLFGHTLAVTQSNALAHYCLGSALAERHAFGEAAAHFEAALKIQPDYPSAEVGLGISLAAQGRVQDARQHLEKAIRLDPRFALAIYNLANLQAAEGDLNGALANFGETVRLNPEFPGAHRGFATALNRLGRPNEAVEHYAEAVRQRPDDLDARLALGRLLAAQGRLDDAMVQFSAAAQTHPQSAEAHNSFGWALANGSRPGEAADHFATALRIDPGYAEAHYNLANLLWQEGKAEDARVHFEQALKSHPDFPNAHRQFALLLAGRREWGKAAAHFQEALRLRPDDTAALEEFAWLRATAGDASARDGAEALRLARRATELTGEREVRALEALAAAQAESGQFEDAVQTVQLALEGARALQETGAVNRLENELKLYRAGKPLRQ